MPDAPTSFFGAATAAPPQPTELENSVPPPSAPAVPAEPIAATEAKADLKAPVTKSSDPVNAPEKKEPAKGKKVDKVEPKTEPEKKDEPKTGEPEAKTGEPEAKPAEKAEPTDEQVKEEDLTPEEEKIVGKMTPKEFRAVFKARNAAEKLAKSRGVELEKALKQVKEVATLKATIAELEKRPTTEANDAKIAAAEAELTTRKQEVERLEAETKDRSDKVKLREFAVDVRKTDDYKKFVTDPLAKMTKDLGTICRGSAEDEEGAGKLYDAVWKVLGIDDEAIRWREMKRAIADVDVADKAAFRQIFETFKLIQSNDIELAGQAEKAKATVESSNKKAEEAKTADYVNRFTKSAAFIRGEMEKEVPLLKMDRSNMPEHLKKMMDEWDETRSTFDAKNVTPETVAALHEMAGTYQIAARASRDFQNQLKAEKAELKKDLDAARAELKELKDAKEKEETDEEREEAEADEVTPSVGNGRSDGKPSLETFNPGETVGKGFSRHVMESKTT